VGGGIFVKPSSGWAFAVVKYISKYKMPCNSEYENINSGFPDLHEL
jgi:hypothetical protein